MLRAPRQAISAAMAMASILSPVFVGGVHRAHPPTPPEGGLPPGGEDGGPCNGTRTASSAVCIDVDGCFSGNRLGVDISSDVKKASLAMRLTKLVARAMQIFFQRVCWHNDEREFIPFDSTRQSWQQPK